METRRIKTGDVVSNTGQIPGLPTNPRQWKRDEMESLKRSLQDTPELFEARGILVYPYGGKYVVLGGNMRLAAAKEIKLSDVPCIIVPEDTPVEKLKAIVIKDNGAFGEWDYDQLANEWDDLPLTDWGVPAWDTKPAEVVPEVTEDNFDGEQDVKTRCALGDVWKLGDHRLMCGDSTSTDAVAKLMDGEKADMVLSDPPYGMNLDTDFSGIHGSLKSLGRANGTKGNKYAKVIGDNEDFSPDLIDTFFANFSYVKEMFLFGADYFAELLPGKNDGSWLVWDKRKESQADAIGSEFELCWSKSKHKRRMLRHDWFGFLSSQDGADARNRVHPTQKPISLLADIIEQWGQSAKVIVDLYGGSGSTLMACEQLGRKCRIMELDPHYCDVILARWEKATGKKAERIWGE